MRWVWMACMLWGGCGAAHAAQLDLFGVGIELPFEAVSTKVEDRRGGGGAISVEQRHHLEVAGNGGAAPHKLLLTVNYVATEGVSNAIVQEAFDEGVAHMASLPGTRSTETVGIDGFTFQFIDGRVDKGDYPERISIGGVVNGALLRVSIFAHDASLFSPALEERLKSIRLEYSELLRAKADFEAEAQFAVVEDSLDTPLSRVQIGRGVRARLVDSYLQRAGDGRPVYRSRSFGLFKAGFWTLQGLSLSVGCGERSALGDEETHQFLSMTRLLQDGDDDDRPVNVSAPTASTLAGLPASVVTAKGGKLNPMRRTDMSRWQAMDDASVYRMEIERFNGSPVEKALIRQLQAAPPACQLGLQFGARSDP